MSVPVQIETDAAVRFAEQVLAAIGTPDDIASIVAGHLVEADQVGHGSHGLSRLPWYCKYVDDGVVVPSARPVVEQGPLAPVVDAGWGFSHAAAYEAMALACDQARLSGIGIAGLVRCTHVGRLGAYVERAAERGCVGLSTYGGMRGPGVAVPFAGSRPLFGANPIAAAIPTNDAPMLLDFSTTEAALGKVVAARTEGRLLDTEAVVEADGTPTRDPEALQRGGALRTFGAHKGFALAALAEMLGQALTGSERFAAEGPGGPSFRTAGGVFIAIDAGAFRDADEVRSAATAVVASIRTVEPASGFAEVLAPATPSIGIARCTATRSRCRPPLGPRSPRRPQRSTSTSHRHWKYTHDHRPPAPPHPTRAAER